MRRRETGKKIVSLMLAVVMAVTLLPVAQMESFAKTDKLMEEYDEIISTYNIDDSILSYKEYIALHADKTRPDGAIEIPAGDYVRYEEGAKLYSMGLHTFQELAKDAKAVYHVKRVVLVNTELIDEYLENFRDEL